MSQLSDSPNEKDNQPTKQPSRNTVVKNCNDGEYSQEFASVIQECYYYFIDKLRLLWHGDVEAIEYTGKVDLDYYCQMPRWDIDTAISLSLGQSPKKIKRYWHRFSSEFKQQYTQRKELLTKATKHQLIPYSYAEYNNIFGMGNLYIIIKPVNFVLWAQKQAWELFFGMEELVKKYAVDGDEDLEEKYKELELENRILKQEKMVRTEIDTKAINVRREKSYQMLIAGLARLKFSSLESINAHNISNHLAELDLPFDMIGEDTIRTLLEPSRIMLGINSNAAKK